MNLPPPNTCTTIIDNGLCGEATPVVVTTGCVHEHFETGPMCDHHRGRLDVEGLGCPTCYVGPRAHVCLIYGRVTS